MQLDTFVPSADIPPPYDGTGIYARSGTSRRRHWWRGIVAVSLAAAALVGTQVAAGRSDGDAMLTVRIERQQPVNVDLRISTARNPYVFGLNVFPVDGTQARDGAYGFMAYDAKTVLGLKGAGITMLRFPGGAWGEAHTPSYEQINAFLKLAQQTHATPLMQVRLAGGTAEQAAELVRYCNSRHDPLRRAHSSAPFVPVHYWAIGNEPDLIGPGYTVRDYVHDFVAFATAMKAVDPSIHIFGPEISEYNGPDAPPRDARNVPWLEGFLQGIAAFERTQGVRLLDGVSIHRYSFGAGSIDSTSLLFASSQEWQYALPLLRDQIRTITGADVPIAITEINTNSGGTATSPFALALWWATTLGTLLEENVAYVDFFAARGVDHPYALLTGSGNATPVYCVMQLYTHTLPDVIPLGSGANPVSVYAATDGQRDAVTLLLINKSPTAAAITVDPIQSFSDWHSRQLRLPPYALACVVLRRAASDQEYLYAPTAQAMAAGQPGTITVQPLR